MDKKPENYYRVFATGLPNVRVISERMTEAEAQSREWGIPLHNSTGTTTHGPVSNPIQPERRNHMNRAPIVVSLFTITLTAVVTKLASGQEAAGEKPVDQVAQLERDWLAADGKGDVAVLRRIVADDFIGQFDGPVLTKEDIIPRDGYRGEFAGATPAGTNIRVFGDTAVLMGSIKTPDINQASEIRVTLVCQKRAQAWQMIAAHLVHAAGQ